MKLYVWTDVLCDYTCGMIAILAPDLDTAMATVDESYVRADMGAKTPEVIDLTGDVEPRAWWAYGGG